MALTTLTVVALAPPAHAVAPQVSVGISGPDDIRAGQGATYTITASNPGSTDGYNFAFFVDVPVGISFDASADLGDPVVHSAESLGTGIPAAGYERWVWEDVADLPPGASVSRSFSVLPLQPTPGGGEDPSVTVFPAGASFTLEAYAAASGVPTLLPVFPGFTGVGGDTAIAETGTSTVATATTTVSSLEIIKSEPSPESELLRGVHDRPTVYTLEVITTTQGSHSDAIVVDYLPAALEFLGCGQVDNSTFDWAPGDDPEVINEYPGAPRLDVVPAVGAACEDPTSVTTIMADAALAAEFGLFEGRVYTEVVWNLGTLAPGSTTTIQYAAGIPLFENTMDWGSADVPDTDDFGHASNLDNNNGPSTRHGSATQPSEGNWPSVDGDSWTNVAAASAVYDGVVRPGTDRTLQVMDTETIDAMDLAIVKSVNNTQFEADEVRDYTLTLRTSEYMDSSEIVIVDTVSNGLCPVLPGGTTWTNNSGASIADCEGRTGVLNGGSVQSVEALPDGRFVLTLLPDNSQELDANGTHVITYQVLNRGEYKLADEYGFTTSGDSFGNTVYFTAQTDAIDVLSSWFEDTNYVWDDSSVTIESQLTEIQKYVMPRSAVTTDPNPCEEDPWNSGEEADFRMGDTVCFELRVLFPGSVDVRNPVVSDFLPAGLEYEGWDISPRSDIGASEVVVDDSQATAGFLRWTVGSENPNDNSDDRYVARGQVLALNVWARVIEPSNGPDLDKPENQMKYRQMNVDGEIFHLRSQASIEVAPELELVKGVQEITDNGGDTRIPSGAVCAGGGNGQSFGSDCDDILVREGEVVTYRIDLSTLPYAATNTVVWDVLPSGIVAADVDPTSIDPFGQAFDFGDAGYPAGLTEFGERSVIVWEGVDVEFDPGSNSFRQTLTYDVEIPSPTSITTTHTNTASIISYAAATNTAPLDPAAQEYFPAGSYDTSLESSWNTDGEGTRDDSEVYLPGASLTKSRTSPEGNNNTEAQVVIGEVAEFSYAVTIPAYTSVNGAILADQINNPAFWTVVEAETFVEHPGGQTDGGDTSFTLNGQTFTINPANGTLTFPDPYTNATADDQVFTVNLSAFINDGAPWTHSPNTSRPDTARFSGTGFTTLTSSVNVRLIEPSPQISKSASDTLVAIGQPVTYTVTAANDTGRPDLFDTVVVDCLPPELTNVEIGTASQGTATLVPDASCAGTRIEWEAGTIVAGSPQSLTYTAEVDPTSAGNVSYINNASITGYSLEGDPNAREYTNITDETITVVPAETTKSVDAPTATIGEEREYTIEVTLPAQVNFYDAGIVDNTAGGTIGISDVSISCTYETSAGSCLGDLHPDVADHLQPVESDLYAWWLGNVDAHPEERTITIEYTGTVLDQDGTSLGNTLTNTARMYWNFEEGSGERPTGSDITGDTSTTPDSAEITVVEPIITVLKNVDGVNAVSLQPGDDFDYSIRVRNTGMSTAFGLVIQDVVPENVVVDTASLNPAATWTPGVATGAGGTITWTISQVLVGVANDVTLSYSASFASSENLTTGALTNTATVTEYFSHPGGDGYDDDEAREYGPVGNSANVTPLFPSIGVTKTPLEPIAYIGEDHTFTVVVSNSGPGVAQDLEVVDVLPAGWAYVADSTTFSSGTTNEPDVSGQSLTWNTGLPLLSNGQSITITYDAVPLESHTWDEDNTGPFAHENTVDVTANDTQGEPGNLDGPYEAEDDASVQIHRADLGLTKSVAALQEHDVPVAGTEYQYTLVVDNAGPNSAVGPIVVHEYLPEDAEFVSATGPNWTAIYDSDNHRVELTHAGPASTITNLPAITITVEFDEALEEDTEILNRACVISARTLDLNIGDDRMCDEVVQDSTRLADIDIDKTAVSTEVVAGETVTWEIDVTNHGPSVAEAPLELTDTLPVGVVWSSITGTGTDWSCAVVEVDGDATNEFLCTWDGAEYLAVDATAPTLTIEGTVQSGWLAGLVNTASVVSQTEDPDLENNEDTSTLGPVDALADLALTKTIVTPDALEGEGLPAGETGRYRIAVINNGSSDALNVEVTDTLPSGLTFAGEVTTSGSDVWTCSTEDQDVTCVLDSNDGTMVVGSSTWFEFDVDIASSVTGEISNTAVVTSTTEDPNPDNNEDTVTEDASVATNLSITKEHDTTTVYRVGDDVTFTVTVTNHGPADAVDVVVTDTIPAGLEFVEVAGSGWSATGPDSGELTVSLDAPLEAGDDPTTASFDVTFTINADAYASATNNVHVGTSTDETTAVDNYAADTVTVASPDLEITKSTSVSITEGGQEFEYTLQVVNVDDHAFADAITVVDTVPAEFMVVTDPADIGGDAWACELDDVDADGFGGTLTCELDTLAAATAAPGIVFTVSVPQDIAVDSVTNTASVSSPDEHPSVVDEHNEDEATVLVRWINFTASSTCVADVPWLAYQIDARNVDSNLPVTFTWYADTDGDGTPDGPAIATQELDVTSTGGSVINGQILWPGAEVDEHGVGIAWPGWRTVLPGETPTFENIILDPTLPEAVLRDGALVVVDINPEASISTDYPEGTPACAEVREPVLDINKVASGDQFHRGETVQYSLDVVNISYGATNDVVVTDPLHRNLRVLSVNTATPAEATIPAWHECTVTGADASGYGGTVECVLNGWLGYGQAAPTITVEAAFREDAELGTITNVATVVWSDPDNPEDEPSSSDGNAEINLALSAQELLALTGFGSPLMLVWALVLMLLGATVLFVIRRREQTE